MLGAKTQLFKATHILDSCSNTYLKYKAGKVFFVFFWKQSLIVWMLKKEKKKHFGSQLCE